MQLKKCILVYILIIEMICEFKRVFFLNHCVFECVSLYNIYSLFGSNASSKGDQCLALSSDWVLFHVINVMYAWFHMRFVSSLMLSAKRHQCPPATSRLQLTTPAF